MKVEEQGRVVVVSIAPQNVLVFNIISHILTNMTCHWPKKAKPYFQAKICSSPFKLLRCFDIHEQVFSTTDLKVCKMSELFRIEYT